MSKTHIIASSLVSLCCLTVSPISRATDTTLSADLLQQTQPSTVKSGGVLIDPPVIRSQNGKLRAQLNMVSAGYSDNSIKYGDVDLFSSKGPFPNASQPNGTQTFTAAYAYQIDAYGKSYAAAFPPPILALKAGDQLDLTITDSLSKNIGELSSSLYQTNFHAHGYHVNPLSMGDNVYPTINDPGTETDPNSMNIKIQVPKNQESGLDWFHPHHHTQTHPQVYGGLAGLLLVGDVLDAWPKYKTGGSNPLKQRFLALSEVNIQKANEAGTTVSDDGLNQIFQYQASNILPVAPSCFNGTNPGSPQCSWQKRVNGQLNPIISFKPGETQVWNIASIGAFGSFNLAVTDGQLSNPWHATLLTLDGNLSVRDRGVEAIDVKPFTMKLSADKDRMLDLDSNTLLMPGNRLAMALTAPKIPGIYYLIDGWGGCNGPTSLSSCTSTSQKYYILATIEVKGKVINSATPTFPVKNPSYALFDAIPDVTRSYDFSIVAPSSGATEFLLNHKIFGELAMPQIQIERIEEWTLTNSQVVPKGMTANHPYHIHQGNFIVTSINDIKIDPNTTNAVNSLNYISPKDTINVAQPPVNNSSKTLGHTTMKIKFKVADYPGKYVFHCHILKHEDQGMMSSVLAFGPEKGLRGAFGAGALVPGNLNVIDGTGKQIATKYPFGKSFKGGLNSTSALGAAKFYDTYAVSQASGGLDVVVYSGATQKQISKFTAFKHNGHSPVKGVSVALADISGDGFPEVIVGSRQYGLPALRIFSTTGKLLRDYPNVTKGIMAGTAEDFPNGINVAAGDIDADNFDDVIIGAGSGHSPDVMALSGRAIAYDLALQSLFTTSTFSAGSDPTSGVRVAVGYVAPGTLPSYLANIITTPETGNTAGTVKVWNTYAILSMESGMVMSTTGLPTELQNLATYSPFGNTTPVQIASGYLTGTLDSLNSSLANGTAGISQVFAWTEPETVNATGFSLNNAPYGARTLTLSPKF